MFSGSDDLPRGRPGASEELAACGLEGADQKGMAQIKTPAQWLDKKYPSAAASLLEVLGECFTVNRLDLPPPLHCCQATTNIIESPCAGVRIETPRVTDLQNSKMVLRWMALT